MNRKALLSNPTPLEPIPLRQTQQSPQRDPASIALAAAKARQAQQQQGQL
jgi:hypothetical protein